MLKPRAGFKLRIFYAGTERAERKAGAGGRARVLAFLWSTSSGRALCAIDSGTERMQDLKPTQELAKNGDEPNPPRPQG